MKIELKNKEEDLGLEIQTKSMYETDTIENLILDVFDFDTSAISNEIKKVDCYVEVTSPLDEYSFLKERVKDFIII